MENIPENVAKKYFLSGDFLSAGKIYADLGMALEQAYCEIYLGNLDKAKILVEKLDKDSPIEEWIDSFLQMLDSDLKRKPSFLQIRNFFETDLSNLFLAGKLDYVEKIIAMIPKLVTINPEIFKLTARVLKDNGQEELALNFLRESLNICFFDAETHFLLAEIYLKYNDRDNAVKHLRYSCQKDDYYPAKKLLKELT